MVDRDVFHPWIASRSFAATRRAAVALLLIALAGAGQAAFVAKSNDSNPLDSTTAWVGGAVPGTNDIAMWTNTITTSQAPVLGDNLAVRGLALYNPSGAQSVAATAGKALTLGVSGIDLSAAATNLTLQCDLLLGTNQVWNVGPLATRALTVTGAVGGPGNLTKSGAGILILTGSNTYEGTTTISAGMLRADDGAGVATNGNVNIAATGVWTTGAAITRTLGTGAGTLQLTGSTCGFSAQGGPVLITLSPAAFAWGAASAFNPTAALILNAGNADSMLTLQNAINLGTAARAIQVSANVAELTGVLSGGTGGSLSKTGTGTLWLHPSADNTYSGGTITSGGIVKAGHPGALGTGLVTLNGGTLQLATDTPATTTNSIAVAVSSTILTDRETSGEGLTQELGALSIGAVTLIVTPGTNVTSGTAGLAFRSTALIGAGPVFNVTSNANLTLGVLSGNLAFSKATGTGALTLASPSSRTGGLATLAAGTLVLADPSGLGAATAPLALSGGTLDLASDSSVTAYPVTLNASCTILSDRATAGDGITHTLGTLTSTLAGIAGLTIQAGTNVTSGTAGVAFGPVSTTAGLIITTTAPAALILDSVTLNLATPRTITFSGSGNAVVTNVITQSSTGNLTLTLNATGGSLTLAGANAHKGGTTLTSGTLNLNHATALGNAAGLFTINGGTINNTSGAPLTNAANNPQSWGGDFTFTGTDDLNLGTGTVSLVTNRIVTVSAGRLTVGGPMTGAGPGLTKTGPGTLALLATNTFTGTTTVNDGTLLIQGATAVGATVNVTASGTLGGRGLIRGTLTVNSGGTLAPGASVGTLTVTNLILQAGSTNAFEFNAGPSNDLVVVASGGTLTINGGSIAFYEEDTTNAWTTDGVYTLIRYSGTVGGTGLTALGVANPAPGKRYALGFSGSNVTVTISTIKTWDGESATDSRWQTGDNWDGDTAPVAPAALTFAGGQRTDATNDFPDRTAFGGLSFAANAEPFTLGGAALNLVGNLVNDSTNLQTIALDLVLDAGSRTINTVAGELALRGTISDDGRGYGLAKLGDGTAILSGDNTFGGMVAIQAGALTVEHANALGGTTGVTTVASGTALQLQGDITTAAEPLTLSGAGVADDGALRNLDGTNTYAGAVTLAADSRIESDAGLLTLNVSAGNAFSGAGRNLTFGGTGDITVADPIATTGGAVTKTGTGILTLAAANTYTGLTTIANGTLRLAACRTCDSRFHQFR
ncbi:MAG: autotransporter-associated beta strand repeat-containing protein [Lentisphaerae bacterium]|nr:autotransporter-associated beta strand repeat-containing protein [Lentisphaerota bacterium]